MEEINIQEHEIGTDNLRDAYKSLRNSTRTTRQNRINAANRLEESERFVQHINIYYSCFAAVVTVLGLVFPEKSFDVASALLTVILSISIVYLNAQKYSERARQMQKNYIQLGRILYETEENMHCGDRAKLRELQEAYLRELDSCENHMKIDHLSNLSYRDKVEPTEDKKRHLRGSEKLVYFGYNIIKCAIHLILWFAPIVYFILIWLKVV